MAVLTGCSDLRDARLAAGTCTRGDDVKDARGAQFVGGGSLYDALENWRLSPHGLAVSPDGSRIAANESWDRRELGLSGTSGTTIWDTDTGRITERFDNGMQGALAWHPDGDMLAVGGATVIDLVTSSGSRLWRLDRHARAEDSPYVNRIEDMAFSPDGARLATLGAEGTVRVWETRRDVCTPVTEFMVERLSARSLAFSPDGADLAICGPSGPVEIWDSSSGTRRTRVAIEAGEPVALTYRADGALLVGTENPGILCDINPAGEIHVGPVITSHGTDSIAVDSAGVHVAATSSEVVTLWDRHSGGTRDLPAVEESLHCLRWSPSGKTLYGINQVRGIRAWEGGPGWRSFEQA